MQYESNAIRAESHQKRNGEVLNDCELVQEQLYVAARLGRIDRGRFADIARQLQREGESDYLTWLIHRHPNIEDAQEVTKRDLRRATVTWQAKALARGRRSKITKVNS